LTREVSARFDGYLEALGGDAPHHRVEFSRRITNSWALIYYRRHLVRLSPYLFLLDASDLRRGSHWLELDATLRHEAAHAAVFAQHHETGHTQAFHAALRRLGVAANGGCDLGPENIAFRFVYGCPQCSREWTRRHALSGNWSCGACAPGRYDPSVRMELRAELGAPWERLEARAPVIQATLRDARLTRPPAPLLALARTR
jgi:hypothetical protein